MLPFFVELYRGALEKEGGQEMVFAIEAFFKKSRGQDF